MTRFAARMKLVPLFALWALASCAAPVEGLWPPQPGEPTRRILVSMDSWHTVIGLRDTVDARSLREYGYADRNYYLVGDKGSSGTCGALFWPTEGVVQVTRGTVPFHRRATAPPTEHWEFELTEKGFERLAAFLDGSRASDEVVSRLARSDWYRAADDYHMFHHCHHYAARALREAGLPVWSSYAMFRWSMAWQLQRAHEMTER